MSNATEAEPILDAAQRICDPHHHLMDNEWARSVARYVSLWNTYKRIVAGCSPDERDELFHGTARRTYLST